MTNGIGPLAAYLLCGILVSACWGPHAATPSRAAPIVADCEVAQLAHWGKGLVSAVVYSPDGRLLAVTPTPRGIYLYDAETLEQVRFIEIEIGVWSLAFSSSGSVLASGLDDGSVLLWRVDDGTLIRALEGHRGPVWSLSFSTDGETLASASYDATVRVWRVLDGNLKCTLDGHDDYFNAVAFSPDGTILASGGGTWPSYVTQLWQVHDCTPLRTLEESYAVSSLAFSPQGDVLASGSYGTGEVGLWRVPEGSRQTTLGGSAELLQSVAFAPDGATLATGSSHGPVMLWRIADGSLLYTLEGHSDSVWSLDFSPDGTTLASASMDGTVRLWQVPPAGRHEI